MFSLDVPFLYSNMPLIVCACVGILILAYLVYMAYLFRTSFRGEARKSLSDSVNVYVKELPENFILRQSSTFKYYEALRLII